MLAYASCIRRKSTPANQACPRQPPFRSAIRPDECAVHLFVDQYREIAGGQVVLQALVKNTCENGFRVGVLAPMSGGLESALVARWGTRVPLHDLKQLDLHDGRKSARDWFRLMAYCVYVLNFWRLAAAYQIIYVNGCRIAPAFALL